jgi:BirA family biotin operon repressor/biotin-[acetyl-CoA-carboxylase] ligase
MSVILRFAPLTFITLAAGVAVCEALRVCGVISGLEWPNDVLINGKKVGGILTERVDDTVILGIGVNLNIRFFPDDLRDRASSVLLETGIRLEKKVVYERLCRKLDECYLMLKNNMTSELLAKWQDYTVVLGQEVVIETAGRHYAGKVLGISNNGALLLGFSDGTTERIIAGTCHLLKQKRV